MSGRLLSAAFYCIRFGDVDVSASRHAHRLSAVPRSRNNAACAVNTFCGGVSCVGTGLPLSQRGVRHQPLSPRQLPVSRLRHHGGCQEPVSICIYALHSKHLPHADAGHRLQHQGWVAMPRAWAHCCWFLCSFALLGCEPPASCGLTVTPRTECGFRYIQGDTMAWWGTLPAAWQSLCPPSPAQPSALVSIVALGAGCPSAPTCTIAGLIDNGHNNVTVLEFSVRCVATA